MIAAMMIPRFTRLAGALLLLAPAVAGCADRPVGFEPTMADFGNAVRHNVAAQVVNPEPRTEPAADFDAARAALMIGRYRADKVEPPKELRTSDVGGGQ